MNAYLDRIRNEPEAVETIQRKLQCIGLYQGPCDGRVGPELQEALAKFKAAHRLDKPAAGDEQAIDLLFRKAGRTFDEVLRDELAALRSGDTAAGSPACAAHRAMLAGLAFSGGGVRSATFNLGILQALAQAKMLQRFDYLSTVSGGGYIGGWLSRWIAEHPQGAAGVERELAEASGSLSEPRQVKFLRQYSNFLTPKVGLFSADTWSLFATYIRNAFLNLVILSFGLAVLLILPRLWISAIANWHVVYTGVFIWTGVAAFLVAVFNIALGISLLPNPASKKSLGQGWVLWAIVLPLMIAAGAGSVGLWEHRDIVTTPWLKVRKYGFSLSTMISGLKQEFPYATEDQLLIALLAPGLVYFTAWAGGWGTAQWLNRSRRDSRKLAYATMPRRIWLQGLGHFLCAIGALAVGSALVIVFAAPLGELGEGTWQAYLSHVASLGMPFLLTIFGITMVVMIGLIGRLYSDKTREWWSRQGGWTIILVLFWTALFLFSVYSPAVVMWSAQRAPAWATSVLAAGWLGTAWASLWAAKQPNSDKPGRAGVLKWLALCGPPLVAVATLTAVSTVIWVALAADRTPLDPNSFRAVLEAQMIDAVNTPWRNLWVALTLCGAIFLVFAFQVDVNKFSLYMMYRNRLVRTYLGAINPKRSPHPFTGFDNNDDVPLHRLAGKGGKVQRPYHIINAALNLVKGKELAWQTRKAANFAFTPRYCGYETPRMPVSASAQAADEASRGLYRATGDYGTRPPDAEETEQGVKLGMAMAVSGAAASSSMGFHSSASLTFLMTLFNVRLGRWCGNPCSRFGWKRASPPSGFYYLLKELLGFTDARSNFLYLSDGGHFENLGIYELVRRRCRLIVVVDASADGAFHFNDLGNAVRKCYTDFNIEIALNVKAIERAADGLSSAYCAAGKILYSKADPGAPDGTVLYIKPSLVGTEYVEIYNYHQTNDQFPHQSTVDQWFDETQFESYRALGNYIGKAVFSPVVADCNGDLSSVESMCEAIRKNWLPEDRKRNHDRPGVKFPNHIRSRATRNPTMSLHSTAENPLRSAERR
jgi:hypothetical protein